MTRSRKTTTRPRKTTTTPAEPAPKPKRADVIANVDRAFRDEVIRIGRVYSDHAAAFRTQAETNPVEAIRWSGEPMAKAQGTWKAWLNAEQSYIEGGGGSVDTDQFDVPSAFAALVDYVTDQILRLADRRPWDSRSSCEFTNAVSRAEAAGDADALSKIRVRALVYKGAIDEADPN